MMRAAISTALFLTAMFVIVPISGAAGSAHEEQAEGSVAGWVQQNSNTGTGLNGIALYDASTALVVGSVSGGPNPVIRHTIDAGANWSTVINNGSTMLNAAQFIDNDTWVLGGAAGMFGRTEDAGATWYWNTVGNPNDFFLDVHFEDPMTGWLVGVLEGGVGPRTPMARTVDGGLTWTKLFPGATYALRGIEFLSPNVAVAAGNNGTQVLILRSVDAGVVWTQVPFPPQGSTTPILALDFVGSSVGFLGSTTARFFKSDDAGLTWTGGLLDNSGGTGDVTGIHFVNVDHGWASTSTGRIYVTHDGAASWTRQTVPNAPGQFYDIRFWDQNNGYACGNGGDIHWTDDGGGVPADTQAPNVTLLTPANNSVVNGTVSVTANATDNIGVTKVRFTVRAVDIGNDTSAPYSVAWNSKNFSNGNHVVTATAYDSAGNTASDPATVVVANIIDNEPPVVSIVNPVNGKVVNGTVTILSNASDNIAVIDVEMFAGGTSLGKDATAPYQWPWDTTTVPDGRYDLLAVATDSSANVNSSRIDVFVKNTPDAPPQVAVTSPAAGAQVKGVLPVTATATDDLAISSVEFLVDGTIAWDDNSAPYSALVDTYKLVDGSHKIMARAWDVAGQSATHEIGVDVANGGGGGADTQPPKVAISSPTAGAKVGGVVKVRAVAVDNVAVVQVELFAGGVSKGTDVSAPYEFDWDSSAANGSIVLRLEASDAAGNMGTDSVTVTVDPGTKPTVAVLAPQASTTVARTVTISISATDDVAVTEVKVFVDGTEIGKIGAAPYVVAWDTTKHADGEHRITASASDGTSSSTSAEVRVTVANAGTGGVGSGTAGLPWLPWLLVLLLVATLLIVALRKRKPAPTAPPSGSEAPITGVSVAQPKTQPPVVESSEEVSEVSGAVHPDAAEKK